ncbi:MAG: holo-ACP synthase [Oscillospiraceae bacterium]|jgi:holo-[acyl-carrier protein] synthase|nr:holo-ACP synthase [Oscillospiraceae bacterium]
MPVYGVGIDLLEIDRMAVNINSEPFMRRVFTPEENEYISSRKKMSAASAAGIFCAKEAFIKAVGTAVPLHGVSVSHDENGKPFILLSEELSGKYAGIAFFLSITHTDVTAAAVVVAEKTQP